MKKSRTVRPPAGVESPTTRRLPLGELLIDTEAELFDLAVWSGRPGSLPTPAFPRREPITLLAHGLQLAADLV